MEQTRQERARAASRERRRAVAARLLELAAATVLVGLGVATALREGAPEERYPELADVDPGILDAVRPHFPETPYDVFGGLPDSIAPALGREASGVRAERDDLLEEALRAAGGEGPAVVLRLVLEQDRGPRTARMWCDATQDETSAPLALYLREHAGRGVRRAALRAVEDDTLAFSTRLFSLIALCGTRDPEVFERLCEISLDATQQTDVRREILARLPRFRFDPPPWFDEHLYLPFLRLNEDAAACLARMGRLEAPSLVLEALRRRSFVGFPAARYAEVLEICAGDDPRVLEAAAALRKADEPRVEAREAGVAIRGAADAFETWIEQRAGAFDTPYETARRRALDRVREGFAGADRFLADPAAWGASDLDLGATLLRIERDEDALLRLELLVDRLREDLRDAHSPGCVVGVLRRRLAGYQEFAYRQERSDLGHTLFFLSGNCVGRSLLHLAVAERLALPLVGVTAPGHMFVRWDEGATRFNLEPTADCEVRPDAAYFAAPPDVAPEEAARMLGEYLQNLTERSVLVVRLANRVVKAVEAGALVSARRDADLALRVDPESVRARIVRAALAAAEGSADDVAAEIAAAEALRALTDHEQVHAAQAFHAAGLHSEALARLDSLHPTTSREADARRLRVSCLLDLGRTEEAREALATIAEDPQSITDLVLTLRAQAQLRDPTWKTTLARLAGLMPREPALEGLGRVLVAQMLLVEREGVPADPAAALEQLDAAAAQIERGNDGLVQEFFRASADQSAFLESLAAAPALRTGRGALAEARIRALVLLGRHAEAEAVRRRAAESEESGD